jgi:phenylalanyl-tRNA synthetase beta chain
MKFSEQWLREWVNPDISTQELVSQITMAGLEVDGVDPVAASFSGVVIGHIQQIEQHPDADKLRVCQVSAGDESFQVVCGAPNARVGISVPFAKIGAVLPGDFKIKKAKLRGVESFGMLCSEKELGISEAADGLMELPEDAPQGKSLHEYLNLNDVSIDVDLTPNRGDCLSIAGLAREVGALNKVQVEVPEINAVQPEIDDKFEVSVLSPAGCPRYLGRVIKGVNVKADTPLWMKEKLRRSGIRSIDPAVDVTNYVLLELGQPMHAFDLNQLTGKLQVRMAEKGERILLLDGQDVALTEGTLLIADERKPLAIAGVMGGEDSGVTPETKDLFLECAFFDPIVVAGKARSYGLHTDASHRYERGVDFDIQYKAMERATALILSILGGQPGPVCESVSASDLPERGLVKLRQERIHQLLGVRIDRTEVEEILTRLGLHIEKLTSDGWMVKVPSYRFDISIEVDLIEEVGRVYGYNNLPVTQSLGKLTLRPVDESVTPVQVVREHLVTLGYQEVVTYSFVDAVLQKKINPDVESIDLANPISSDLAVMRTSLWPGLLNTLSYNQKRQQSRLRLFETGLRFVVEDGELHQDYMLSGALMGDQMPENWAESPKEIDFFDVKGDLESLFGRLGGDFSFKVGQHPALHPGQTAEVFLNNQSVGLIGRLHPQIQKSQNFIGRVYLFELCLNKILKGKVPSYKEVSKFPSVRRDLAVVVSKEIEFDRIKQLISQNAGEWFQNLVIFDVYEGAGVPDGAHSLAMGLTWQHPQRTLNDEDVDRVFDGIVAELNEKFGAKLRS